MRLIVRPPSKTAYDRLRFRVASTARHDRLVENGGLCVGLCSVDEYVVRGKSLFFPSRLLSDCSSTTDT